MIVVDTTMTIAPITAINIVVLSIISKSNLASGVMASLAIQGLAEPSAELLRSFAKEMLLDRVRLLAFDCPVKNFLLKESLKKGRDRLNSLVVEHFTAQNKLFAVALVVQHLVPLQGELSEGFGMSPTGRSLVMQSISLKG
jgi:hypothetical protein